MAARGDDELFRSREAQLYIGEGAESFLMQSGDFALVLVKNAVSQLAAVVATVGAVQWPVGRDCAVTRTGESSFSFSLPGLLSYTLVLRSTAADLQSLEKLLEEYAACSSRPAAGREEHGGSQQADKQVEICSVLAGVPKMAGDDLSPEMVGRLQRARRMSAIAKVFSKTLERGTINAANHVKPMGMAATQDSRSSSLNLALAGVDAVAKVVEAVEMGGRTLRVESAGSGVTSKARSAQGSSPTLPQYGLSGLICSGWTLNNHGLLMLFRMITASMAMNSGGSSRSGSSRSGSSSSSEFRRLLSSSPSSSSLSSKSPSPRQAGPEARGADATSVATLPPPVSGTALSPHDPPPPPLFTSYAPRARMSDMPPPSGPRPPIVPLPLDSQVSSPFRIYKPRPTAPATPLSTQPVPPPFIPRPPRFQPPQN